MFMLFLSQLRATKKSQSQNTHHKSLFSYVVIFQSTFFLGSKALSHTLSLRCDFEGFLVVFSRPFAKRPPRPRVVRLPNFYLVGLLLLLEHTSAILTAEYPKAGANTQLVRARARAQTNTHLGALLHAFASVFEPVQFSLYWPAPSYSSSPLKGRGAKVKHLAGLPERASLAGSSRGIFHSLTSSTKVQKIGYNLV